MPLVAAPDMSLRALLITLQTNKTAALSRIKVNQQKKAQATFAIQMKHDFHAGIKPNKSELAKTKAGPAPIGAPNYLRLPPKKISAALHGARARFDLFSHLSRSMRLGKPLDIANAEFRIACNRAKECCGARYGTRQSQVRGAKPTSVEA